MKSNEIFIKKLKQLRVRDNKSQEDLAFDIDVNPKTISAYESPKTNISFDYIDKFSEIGNVLPSYFFNPVDLSLKYSDNEKKELLIKKLAELNSTQLDFLFKMAFVLDENSKD